MIIEALGNLVLWLLDTLLIFELPPFPETVTTVFNSVLGYLVDGRDVIQAFIGSTAMGVVGVCLLLIVAANGIYMMYSLLMFVLKKIPFLGIKE